MGVWPDDVITGLYLCWLAQSELESARKELEVLEVRDEELTCELELLKEQLADSQDQNQHLGHNVCEWAGLSPSGSCL